MDETKTELELDMGRGNSRALPDGSCRTRPSATKRTGWVCFLALILVLAGCTGPLSTLEPAGPQAEAIARLFWWMVAGAVIIWSAVVGIAVYAIQFSPESHSPRKAKALILGGGVALPTVLLAVLLAFGLALLPELVARAPEGSLRIEVTGERWWWRVHYLSKNGTAVELANEIRLPVGETVEFVLNSRDVVHSFWIPALGGKMDMIPGRTTHLVLEPTRVGTFRGACAEYCGTAHALMNFEVVVLEKLEFEKWLERQRQPSAAPAGEAEVRGQEMFLANGCGACHTIRGTVADGVLGPDLTHIGSRLTVGAGIRTNQPHWLLEWVRKPEEMKPGVRMPAFGMLPHEDLEALAAYLKGLE